MNKPHTSLALAALTSKSSIELVSPSDLKAADTLAYLAGLYLICHDPRHNDSLIQGVEQPFHKVVLLPLGFMGELGTDSLQAPHWLETQLDILLGRDDADLGGHQETQRPTGPGFNMTWNIILLAVTRMLTERASSFSHLGTAPDPEAIQEKAENSTAAPQPTMGEILIHLEDIAKVKKKTKITHPGWARWLTPVIPALWEAEMGGSPEVKTLWKAEVDGSPEVRSSRPARRHGKNLPLLKVQKISWLWWRVPVISATQEAEVTTGRFPAVKPRGSPARLFWPARLFCRHSARRFPVRSKRDGRAQLVPSPQGKQQLEALRTESFTAGAANPGRGEQASAKGKLRNRKTSSPGGERSKMAT
ncbi:hypothetical protein AAY473_026413 [Plecturocebus cupreus]